MELDYLLNLPGYVINMPNKEQLYLEAKADLEHYGFKNINRFVSFNAADKEKLNSITEELKIKQFEGSPSQCSLMLAHLSLLNMLVATEELQEILIFEDDVRTHTDFTTIAPLKLKDVEDYGILFLGAAVLGNTSTGADKSVEIRDGGILQTHAYSITKEAANFVIKKAQTSRAYAIDQMYSNYFRGQKIKLCAIINTPHTSKNRDELRTHQEQQTGLMFQKNHISTVFKF